MKAIVLLFMLGQLLRVVQQPVGQWDYVSDGLHTITQWQDTREWRNIGLLAHAGLAGQYMERMETGDHVALVYADGRIEDFSVAEVHHYMFEGPNMVEGSDNRNGEAVLRSMFAEGRLTFQTCIPCPLRPGPNSMCGLLFVVADKYSQPRRYR